MTRSSASIQSETSAATTRNAAVRVHRIEVRPKDVAGDPRGDSVRRSAQALGFKCSAVRTAGVYLIEADLREADVRRLADQLLADPILEQSTIGSGPAAPGARTIEVLPLPGVMDPTAQTVEQTVRDMLGMESVRAATGIRYDIEGIEAVDSGALARALLANPVIESIHEAPYHPQQFPHAPAANNTLRHIAITALDDAALIALSRQGHLFLSLHEMRTIQKHYRTLKREPTDIELETLAQTWSEHCVHKTLKSTIHYRNDEGTKARRHEGDGDPVNWDGRPGVEVKPDGSVVIRNLFKSTIVAATRELIEDGVDWTLSVFADNAGIIKFDENHAVCVKVETHNHPSAIEPYGGAATGVGGCIRDIIGTGLGAKPIANTDVFCVANPDHWEPGTKGQRDRGTKGGQPLPDGCLHPRRILTRVVDGVRDYGNRMGIPTVNGAVFFDDRYVGNPLVFCGCIGVMPRDRIKGKAQPGDRIVAIGGRTGRDGLHGATFSSAELTHSHADEFSHAVQIGNAITEKRVLDAVLRARDYFAGEGSGTRDRGSENASAARCLYSAITDCGAGGFSSAVGEMGKEIGAQVHLERAPLKYQGLRYDEIWISESQERMVLAVKPGNMAALKQICEEEGVEVADLGEFGTRSRDLVLFFRDQEVGRLSMEFLHEGIPMPVREAVWRPKARRHEGTEARRETGSSEIRDTLLRLLADPSIASKRWIVRQYDHEVQGNTIIKPLVGPGGIGPGDATVIQPVPGSKQGLAIACGMATAAGDPARGGDPYLMALAAVDECVRNLVCVGADPDRIAILDNFCWPGCDKPENLASLVRAAIGCYDAAKAYRTPFISGKDSLNNQFTTADGRTIEIPPTLLITGVGIVPDVSKCVTMDAKCERQIGAENTLYVIGPKVGSDAGIVACAASARGVARLIQERYVCAAHDCSEGGLLVTLAEMLIASDTEHKGCSFELDLASLKAQSTTDSLAESLFGEAPARYVVEVPAGRAGMHSGQILSQLLDPLGVPFDSLGLVMADRRGDTSEIRVLRDELGERTDFYELRIRLQDLRRAFLGTLDW